MNIIYLIYYIHMLKYEQNIDKEYDSQTQKYKYIQKHEFPMPGPIVRRDKFECR